MRGRVALTLLLLTHAALALRVPPPRIKPPPNASPGSRADAAAPPRKRPDPPLLTANIRKATTVNQLFKQHERNGEYFNHIHCAAFWAKLGQLAPNGAEHQGFVFIQPMVLKSVPFVRKDFGRAELAGTAHGLAKAGLGKMVEVQPLWIALAETCIERLDEFTPRELATLAWSLGKGRAQQALMTEELLSAIALKAAPCISGFAPQGLSNLAWAYARADHHAPALLAAIEGEAIERAADFKCQEVANTAWAFASLGRHTPELFRALAISAHPRLAAFRRGELAMLGWAFAVADAGEGGALLCGDGAFAKLAEDKFCTEHDNVGSLTQLHQWSLWRAECGGKWPGVSASFVARCREAVFADGTALPSGFEMGVQSALKRMGLRTQQKVRTAEGYVIDLWVESTDGRRQIALEIDGPANFLGWSRMESGATTIKRRQLRHFGYRLLTIPYWEWEVLQGAEEEKRYLTLAIAAQIAVNARSSAAQTGPSVDSFRHIRGPLQHRSNGLGAPLLSGQKASALPAETLPHRPASATLASLMDAAITSKGGKVASGEDAAADGTDAESGDASGSGSSPSPEPAEAPTVATAGKPTQWVRGLRASSFGDELGTEAMCDAAASARIAFVGEVYAQSAVIAIEAAILHRMVERLQEAAAAGAKGGATLQAAPCVYVVLEQFNFEMQPLLDRFMTGELSIDTLSQEYAATGDEGHNVKAYAPLLHLARELAPPPAGAAEAGEGSSGGGGGGGVRVQLVGGFLPRAIARLAVADGLDAALAAAKAAGFVRDDEDCAASEEHYAYFEALCSGRPMYEREATLSDSMRRIFPAQVIKACSMARRVSRIVEEEEAASAASGGAANAYKVLVCCGASHMAFGFGVPERTFAAHPALRAASYSIHSYAADEERGVLDANGLEEVFGSPQAGGPEVADAAFMFYE